MTHFLEQMTWIAKLINDQINKQTNIALHWLMNCSRANERTANPVKPYQRLNWKLDSKIQGPSLPYMYLNFHRSLMGKMLWPRWFVLEHLTLESGGPCNYLFGGRTSNWDVEAGGDEGDCTYWLKLPILTKFNIIPKASQKSQKSSSSTLLTFLCP